MLYFVGYTLNFLGVHPIFWEVYLAFLALHFGVYFTFWDILYIWYILHFGVPFVFVVHFAFGTLCI